MATRERIGHAFTPWEWRSRTTVIALVVVMAGLMVVGPVLVLTNDLERPAKALNIVVRAAFAYFVGLRPAVRSLRRWDELHPAEPVA